MTAPMPTKDEFEPDEILIQAHTEPDSLNRVRFTAFWLDGYLPPTGVCGQVFYTSVEEFTTRCERRGHKVRHWNPTTTLT